MNATVQHLPELPLTKRLKVGTSRDHDSVDNLVMGARPFENLDRYANFLRLQHRFHGAINELYADEDLNTLLPGLHELHRFDAVCADLTDLGLAIAAKPQPIIPESLYAALGWLYCSEGSNIGAAFLFKESQQLGLDSQRGARHLAPHPDGRGLHWRQFVALLDGLDLSEEQKNAATQGAVAAFDYYRKALKEIF